MTNSAGLHAYVESSVLWLLLGQRVIDITFIRATHSSGCLLFWRLLLHWCGLSATAAPSRARSLVLFCLKSCCKCRVGIHARFFPPFLGRRFVSHIGHCFTSSFAFCGAFDSRRWLGRWSMVAVGGGGRSGSLLGLGFQLLLSSIGNVESLQYQTFDGSLQWRQTRSWSCDLNGM